MMMATDNKDISQTRCRALAVFVLQLFVGIEESLNVEEWSVALCSYIAMEPCLLLG